MKVSPLGVIVAAVGGLLLFKGPERQLQAGKMYRATFDVVGPVATPAFLEGVRSIMPPSSTVTLTPVGQLIVTFLAPSSAALTDVPVPGGELKLKRLESLS